MDAKTVCIKKTEVSSSTTEMETAVENKPSTTHGFRDDTNSVTSCVSHLRACSPAANDKPNENLSTATTSLSIPDTTARSLIPSEMSSKFENSISLSIAQDISNKIITLPNENTVQKYSLSSMSPSRSDTSSTSCPTSPERKKKSRTCNTKLITKSAFSTVDSDEFEITARCKNKPNRSPKPSQDSPEREEEELPNKPMFEMNRQEFLAYQKKLLYMEKEAEMEREVMKTVSNSGEGVPGVLAHLELVAMSSTHFGRLSVTFASFAHRKLPSHGLRKGDNVSVYSGSSMCRECDHCMDGVVLFVSSQDVMVTIDKEHNFQEDSSYSLKHYPSMDNHRRIMAGLRQMGSPHGQACHLAAVLFQEEPLLPPLPRLPSHLYMHDTKQLNLFNRRLDASQVEAVEFALLQQDLVVVHGPPGTGKTTALLEIILQHVKMGVKVLALAPSNLGVDNLVERLDDVGMRVVRIGHPARTTPATQRHTIDALLHNCDASSILSDIQREIHEVSNEASKARSSRRVLYKELGFLRRDLTDRQDRLTRELVRRADVVLCTLVSAHENGALRHLSDDHFGLTVIDECSQGTESSCYLGVLRSPKLVLAGDHKQLPPTVLNPLANDLLISLMERVINMHGSKAVKMLTVQYRMHEQIMAWSSQVMYENKLTAHEQVRTHTLCQLPGVKETSDTSCPLHLVDTSACAGFQESDSTVANGVVSSKSNDGEASLVLGIVKRLVDAGVRQDQVAVITPYSKQVKLVRSLVCTDYKDVEVQTVDGFQGREKEAVVLSLVRSNDKGDIGFLSEDRRLNVAVTRARRYLAVVCNTQTLRQNTFLKSFVDYMMDNATVVSAENTDEANCIHRSIDCRDIDLSEILKPIKKVSIDESPKTEEEIAKEKEAEEEERRVKKMKKYEKVLNRLMASSSRQHCFPMKLSSFDRMLVHDVAETLGLYHYSVGFDEKRRIIVSKEAKQTRETGSKTDDLETIASDVSDENMDCKEEIIASNYKKIEVLTDTKITLNINKDSVRVKTKKSNIKAVVQDQSTLKHCTLCGKNVPHSNFTTHRVGCERKEKAAINKQKKDAEEKRQQQQNEGKKTKQKNKASSTSPAGNEDEDDFDAVLSSFSADNKRCNVHRCEDHNKLLFQACPYCHRCYCLKHFIAEGHGCGHHARTQARATVMREGVIYPGSGVPSKLPRADKKAQMQRKINSKIADMEHNRKQNQKKK